MSRFLSQLLKITCLLFLGFVAGTFFAFREAPLAFHMVDSLYRGALATANLKQLDKGNDESTRALLNSEVDQGLYYFSLTEDAWWYPLYKQELIFPESYAFNTKYIHRLATYRKQNPNPDRDLTAVNQMLAGQDAEFLERLKQMEKDRLRRISLMLERFAEQ